MSTTTESPLHAEAERAQVNRLDASSGDDAPFAVRARRLVKRYRDGTLANRGIDLDVRRGEVVTILGPNGAGKTTFLRQLTTELMPTAGSVNVFGVDAVKEPLRAKRAMGITPQEAGLFEALTVREHLEFFARFKNLSTREARAAAHEVIAELGLIDETNKPVGNLSGGQRRRILIGLALLGRPPLLVLDEPTTGLDPASRHAVWKVIRRAVAEGATVILSTHYMEEAERLSNRIGIIAAGRLIACGSLDELLARLERSYRLSYRDPQDPLGDLCISYFASFAEAQERIAREQLNEYSIARASLEDVYFTLTGEPFDKGGTEVSA
ncbi:MAG TPA: ABC transporter ATP-binding protein [Pyrinomonadaceae bacterium]|nr:ABC transporter ATP-binding protein [Pyrinomonadaceae bacterium]